MFDLTDPMYSGFRLVLPSPNTLCSADVSSGSPTLVPVPMRVIRQRMLLWIVAPENTYRELQHSLCLLGSSHLVSIRNE
jgi:hypothetical protein